MVISKRKHIPVSRVKPDIQQSFLYPVYSRILTINKYPPQKYETKRKKSFQIKKSDQKHRSGRINDFRR